jgi:hypothetical protein
VVNPIVPLAVFIAMVSSATTAAVQGQPKSSQEFCKSAKEPAQCLATRALLARLKAGDKTARWTNDFNSNYLSGFEEMGMFATFMDSAQAAPPDEYCRNAKEQKKCLATRALIGQVRTKDKTARWSEDIGLAYAQNVKEQKLLIDFWIAVTPPPAPPEEYCAKAKEQKKCLATRNLLAQVIARDKAARWSDDVEFLYTRNDVEANILFKFMLDDQVQVPKRK